MGMRRKLWIWMVTGLVMVINSCNKPGSKGGHNNPSANSPAQKDKQADTLTIPVVQYHLLAVKRDSAKAIMQNLAPNLPIILALNRVDSVRIWRQDTLVIPDTILDWNAYCPFPLRLRMAQPIPKLIFYSYAVQAFAAYQNGELLRWGPVSMGKKETPTPTGLFHTNWRAKKTTSTVDDEWIMEWYFNLQSAEGVSMHQYEMPGYPASHACVRLYMHDAYFFYYWCQTWLLNKNQIAAYGTPVIIYGKYTFGQRRPWRALAENGKALTITETELGKELKPYLSLILQRQAQRDSLEAIRSKPAV